LIITEDGTMYPLLMNYDKNYSLKDLGITRWSKLKYRVERQDDPLAVINGDLKNDFYFQSY